MNFCIHYDKTQYNFANFWFLSSTFQNDFNLFFNKPFLSENTFRHFKKNINLIDVLALLHFRSLIWFQMNFFMDISIFYFLFLCFYRISRISRISTATAASNILAHCNLARLWLLHKTGWVYSTLGGCDCCIKRAGSTLH